MSMLPLATVTQLEERLGVPVGSIQGEDLTRAQRNLEDASTLIRAESGIAWVDSVGIPIAPDAVVVIVLQMAKRVYENPSNLSGESVGSYSYQNDQASLGIYLTDDELRSVKAATMEWMQQQSPTRWSGTGSITMRPAYRPQRDRREWYQ